MNIKKNLKKIIPYIKARYAPRGARQTFSTCGEDLIMSDMLDEFSIDKPHYIDIGAHHPVFGNNTYLMYKKGGTGVLVEPNPVLGKLINKKRPKDTCLNVGAGKEDGEADFFAFKRDTRSTFSTQQAGEWESYSGQKPEIMKHTIISLDSIINKYFFDIPLDIISIDAEGYDVEILAGFSWQKRPKLVCVESVIRRNENGDSRDKKIYDLFENNNYKLEVQTRNNSIFVDCLAVRK